MASDFGVIRLRCILSLGCFGELMVLTRRLAITTGKRLYEPFKNRSAISCRYCIYDLIIIIVNNSQ